MLGQGQRQHIIYMSGHTLGDFIQEYCAANNIYCDDWIMNMAFGFDMEWSEAAAVRQIEETALLWRLRDIAIAEQLQKRN